jgi:hypothetical protein
MTSTGEISHVRINSASFVASEKISSVLIVNPLYLPLDRYAL